MTFAEPITLMIGLLLVPAAIAAYVLVQRRRRRYAVRFTNVDLVANLVPRQPGWRRHIPPVLYLVAIASLATALARPSMAVEVPREEATVVLAIDVSRSMTATDVGPSRLAAAKAAASDFVEQLPDTFRIALVSFSTEARLVVPPTTDKAEVIAAIERLNPNGGTALGDAIHLSLEASGVISTDAAASTPSASASPAPSSVPALGDDGVPIVATVLLSDGANSTGALDPLAAANEAAQLGVPVYTIALGTANGVVQVPNNVGVLRPLAVPPDTASLNAIAETTGALSFEAPTSADLASIYENLGSRIGFTVEQQEVTYLFAGVALVFVLAGAGLAAFWFNRFP